MFKRSRVRKNRKPTSWERLDQLMCIMANDEVYEMYLDVKTELQVGVEL